MDVDYIPVETAAALLGVSTRHAHRACKTANVRSTKAGKRALYHRLDVERLAVDLGAAYRHVDTLPHAPGSIESGASAIPDTSTALVPYDALQRQLREVQSELAEVKRMLAQLLDRQPQPTAPPAPAEPVPQIEPMSRRSWWRRLFR